MLIRIQKRFIAAVAATAIVITSVSSVPARADNNDAAAAIAALVGLAVIGAVIADKRSDRKEARRQAASRPQAKPIPPRVSRKLLPQQCLRSFETDRGPRRIFAQRCLNRNYAFVNALPRRCHREFWTDRGWRQGYGARCLRREGFELARR